MNGVKLRLGPLALVLTVITVCLTILSMLDISTAMADYRLAQHFAVSVSESYALETEGYSMISSICEGDAEIDELMTQSEDGIYAAVIDGESSSLHIEAKVNENGGLDILSFRIYGQWQEDDSMGDLWAGPD